MDDRTNPMPPKLDDESDTIRIQIVAPRSWAARIDDWRRLQEGKIPSQSAAIRQLVDERLDEVSGQKGKRRD